MTTLVTGASGKVGRHVLDGLTQRGVAVRPATRRTDVPLDWADPAGWDAALDDVDQVFLVLPGGDDGHRSVSGLGQQVIGFLDLAEQRGVSRVVLMTALGMQYAPADVDQRAVELRLQNSSMRWTVVRPNWFYQNLTEGPLRDLADAHGGRLSLPTGAATVSFIDARDIAAVITAALVADHHGREYTLTGPESLSFTELARLAAKAGLPILDYQPVAEPEFRARTLALGWDHEYVDTLCGLFAAIAAGHAAPCTADVADVLGRPPVGFAEFTSTHQT
ncbi:NAD(P)H-binding protein [Phytoactinopolyspora limicola]|uniref:NAD(P)H-binding protein n=1 Tax=Phytoactinopolyspora limicola TaxID=2715536 RepID=UPI00140E4E9D|nr:NAD(P)H-binding protein [Phytoactinopolyspora limicola]